MDCLSPFVGYYISPLSIWVTFRPFRTLQQELVHPKHPVPGIQKKEVVYSTLCVECFCAYIGQTGRSLDQQRLWDYHRAVKNGDLVASTLAEHVFSCNHQVDLTMVIDTLPYTDSQHARVLAYPTPTGNHTQHRQGHSAWTLCCTAGLTLPLLDYYYYY